MKSSPMLDSLSNISKSSIGETFAVERNRWIGIALFSVAFLVGSYLYLIPNSITVRAH
jgi:hypothetical protein